MSIVSHSLGLCSFPTCLSKKRFSVWDYCFVGCLSNALQFLLRWVPLACPAGLASVVSVVSDTAGNPLAAALLMPGSAMPSRQALLPSRQAWLPLTQANQGPRSLPHACLHTNISSLPSKSCHPRVLHTRQRTHYLSTFPSVRYPQNYLILFFSSLIHTQIFFSMLFSHKWSLTASVSTE